MMPTMMVGDLFLIDMSVDDLSEIERGDVLIFTYPKDPAKDYVKRVIGMPGDTLEIRDKILYINDTFYQETYVIHEDARIIPGDRYPWDNFGPLAIPDKSLFVMGDNRDFSNDSRFLGFLNVDAVKGKAGTFTGHGTAIARAVEENREEYQLSKIFPGEDSFYGGPMRWTGIDFRMFLPGWPTK